MYKIFLLAIAMFALSKAEAQFISEQGDTLYGNEWIDFDQEYFKISIAEDGMYRISYEELISAGVPVNAIAGESLQMYHNGEEYPIYVNNAASLGSGDFVEFYGRKNRGELDEIFYEDVASMQLNPEYSLFTDTSAYFLSWNSSSSNLRVNEIQTVEFSDQVVEQFYMHKERVVYSNRIHKPTRNGSDNVRYSHFDVGEGFGGALNKKNTVTLRSTSVFDGGTEPSVDIRFTTNATAHEVDFSINNDVKATWKHSGYAVRQEHVDFPISELRASNSIILEGQVDNVDRNILAVVDLNYPREFDFENQVYFEFFMGANSEVKYSVADEFNGGSMPIVYDPATGTRVSGFLDGNQVQLTIPASAEDRTLVAYNSAEGIKSVQVLEKMEFVDYSEMDGEYIIISHPKLMTGSTNAVQEYADYRSSSAGGDFNSVVVNVEDLYEQFSYGVHRHSYSVKNFVNWAKKNWNNSQYVFIIGKGREYPAYRTEAQINNPLNSDYTVPTFGYPGSDNILVSSGEKSATHLLPAGRLAAKKISDVELYFDKIKVHEEFDSRPQTIAEKLWKKQIMHLAGAETSLQESIGSYLRVMEEQIEGSQYGARVTTYKKSSTETIQEADAAGLINTIDRGISVMTFFGHSSVGTFDFNIDDVNKLNNYGKYPLVISLGCYSGNIHTGSYGISEQYVTTANRGAIAFMASSSTAYVSPQGNFGERYYDRIGGEYFGSSLGKVFQSTLRQSQGSVSISQVILNEQMTFHGDPAIRLHKAEGPDFVFDYSSIKTAPDVVESNSTEFEFAFKIANLGSSIRDSIDVKLEHHNSDGEMVSSKELRFKSPAFDTLLKVVFPTGGSGNVGRNSIKGEVDYTSQIDELPNPTAENNNLLENVEGEAGYSFFAINNSAVPVSPCNFDIYDRQDVVLKASTFNALGKDQTKYLFEIDTTPDFNSSFRQRTEIQSLGGLMEWLPTAVFEEEKVYYWRVSPDSTDAEIGYKWEDASFVYLPNSSSGWNQSHYYQYLDNEFDGIEVQQGNNFEFLPNSRSVAIKNGIYNPNVVGYQVNYSTFSVTIRPWNFMSNGGVAVTVLNPVTGGHLVNSGGDYGSINTNNIGGFRAFCYDTSIPESRNSLVDFLENEVPEGYFVSFFTILRSKNHDFGIENWEEIYRTLETQGAVLVRGLDEVGSVPYNFMYQKNIEALDENIATDPTDLISTQMFYTFENTQGSILSSEIGPSKNWEKLVWKTDMEANDTTSLEIIGINNEGNTSSLGTYMIDPEIDLSFIDPEAFPYLQLRYAARDEVDRTSSDLNYWRVFYEGIPDIAITNIDGSTIISDTIQQGQELKLSYVIANNSDIALDSFLISYEVINANNVKEFFLQSVDGIDALAKKEVTFTIKTNEYLGQYQIILNLNYNKKFEEKIFSNNFGASNFYVAGDKINPVLDVFFDGSKILDGDYISSEPVILVELRDENDYLLLDDPSAFQVALESPEGIEEIIDNSDARMIFTPASESENKATIELRPSLLTDGLYKLTIQATDRLGNISGDLNYTKEFQVINEQLISEVYNYPNPFSTSTEFIFTLTGSQLPSELSILIYSVSGKLIKEIFQEQLGPLKIGINRTTYKWDGTDQYGSKLANGVYFYKVNTKNSEGERLGKLDSTANGNFKNELGKLVILR